ncbi:MAG: response regulator [Acidobacteria bacterium]|nr:response regulator [Acidobacteriota bacterium]
MRDRQILVVDDDPDTVEVATRVLHLGGYRVLQALSGEAALRRATQFLPDLILLDVQMPEMDGWEVLRALQVDAGTRAIPVAMFTVRGELRHRMHGLQQGAFDYITKPFSADELLDRVGRIFQRLGGEG